MTEIKEEDFNVITEGQASILFPKKKNVFYNPIQQFNRDLSVMAIRSWYDLYQNELTVKNKKRKRAETNEEPKENTTEEEVKTYKPKFNILEALSATGLRAIRYAKEIPHVGTIIANDLLPAAVESINRNVQYNKVGEIVKGNIGDANKFMYANEKYRFKVIDLDPYGSAAPFIDAAIQSVENNGLLLVTCTDLGVLAGNGYPEKCFALYNGTTLPHSTAVHESALRLVIGLIATTAAKYKKTIEPILSLSIDFYVRIFIRVHVSPNQVKNLLGNMMTDYVCSGCGSITTQPLGKVTFKEEPNPNNYKKYSWAQQAKVGANCEFCGHLHHICGPMWSGKLHNLVFCDKLLEMNESLKESGVYKTYDRIKGMVTLARNELPGDEAPFYFSPAKISSILKIACPSITQIVAGLGSLGYEASLTHAMHGSVKTNASYKIIWKVFLEYIKEKNIVNEEKLAKMNENLVGYKILKNDKIDFENDQASKFDKNEVSEKIDKLRKVKIVRYQMNPTKNWGPKAKPQ